MTAGVPSDVELAEIEADLVVVRDAPIFGLLERGYRGAVAIPDAVMRLLGSVPRLVEGLKQARRDAEYWRQEWEDADAKWITAEHERDAALAQVERVRALLETTRRLQDPDSGDWDVSALALIEALDAGDGQ